MELQWLTNEKTAFDLNQPFGAYTYPDGQVEIDEQPLNLLQVVDRDVKLDKQGYITNDKNQKSRLEKIIANKPTLVYPTAGKIKFPVENWKGVWEKEKKKEDDTATAATATASSTKPAASSANHDVVVVGVVKAPVVLEQQQQEEEAAAAGVEHVGTEKKGREAVAAAATEGEADQEVVVYDSPSEQLSSVASVGVTMKKKSVPTPSPPLGPRFSRPPPALVSSLVQVAPPILSVPYLTEPPASTMMAIHQNINSVSVSHCPSPLFPISIHFSLSLFLTTTTYTYNTAAAIIIITGFTNRTSYFPSLGCTRRTA